MHTRPVALACSLGALVLSTACAAPTTQLGPVPADTLRTEPPQEQQLTIARDLRQQQRVDDVGYALLTAATPFCSGALAPRTGVRVANVHSFPQDDQPAARALGFSDTLVVVSAARGSTAQRAGFAVGDRVIALNGGAPPVGADAVQTLARAIADRRASPANLTLRQGNARFLSDDTSRTDAPASSGELRITVPADTVCGYNLVAARTDELNAWTDGRNVTVTAGMLGFVANDDELASLLAHEISHNALRHTQAQSRSAAAGHLAGAMLDIADTTQGVNTQSEVTQPGVNVGSTVFSPDVEREADYVGMYLLARAGRSTAKAANLWHRIAHETSGSIKYASTHPTTAERFVRLEQTATEIEQTIARGEDLRPKPRGAAPSTGRTTGRASAAPTRTVTSKGELTVYRGTKMERMTPEKFRPTVAPSPDSLATVASAAYSMTLSTGDSVSYTFGPAVARNGLSLAEVRRRALQAYQDATEALELRLYERAEVKYREAVLYDGGEARYHAALGTILQKRGKRAAAEAALSAAVLLDVENATYRQLLVEVRRTP